MAKTRVTVNETELFFLEEAKKLAKLRTRRGQKAEELAALDNEIVGQQQVVNGLACGEPAKE